MIRPRYKMLIPQGVTEADLHYQGEAGSVYGGCSHANLFPTFLPWFIDINYECRIHWPLIALITI